MKTILFNSLKVKHKVWWIIDAKQAILGRIAAHTSFYLQGKHKCTYTPNCDLGDYVIIINANHVMTTGNKSLSKIYYRHSGYPGGLKKQRFIDMHKKDSVNIFKNAIKRMLPKNKLSDKMFSKLKIYKEMFHPHASQKPKTIHIKNK
jgi:large subunit ribosomal protein L13